MHEKRIMDQICAKRGGKKCRMEKKDRLCLPSFSLEVYFTILHQDCALLVVVHEPPCQHLRTCHQNLMGEPEMAGISAMLKEIMKALNEGEARERHSDQRERMGP